MSTVPSTLSISLSWVIHSTQPNISLHLYPAYIQLTLHLIIQEFQLMLITSNQITIQCQAGMRKKKNHQKPTPQTRQDKRGLMAKWIRSLSSNLRSSVWAAESTVVVAFCTIDSLEGGAESGKFRHLGQLYLRTHN